MRILPGRSIIAGALLVASAHAPRMLAQRAALQGSISGTVIDAESGAPLSRATVTLASSDGFGILADAREGSSQLALARTVITATDGSYRFTDLSVGDYLLRIRRVGYEPASIQVRLGDAATSPISVGLVVLPVRLRAVDVRAKSSPTGLDAVANVATSSDRVLSARARQEAYLATDVRELTRQDIGESATLGGSDVLRSLQRLPGVATFDAWSAKLLVRGNRWDHNRVYFDDLPLFDPLGVLGRTSAVSAMAVGAAFLHPGVRPASLAGDGATRIDIRSRTATPGSPLIASAEVSQFGVSASLERGTADSAAAFLLTMQAPIGRWLPSGGAFSEGLNARIYNDVQATLRGDIDLGGGVHLAASGLVAHDSRVPPSDGPYASRQDWANAAGRLTLAAPLGALVSQHTIAFSTFTSSSDRWIGSPAVLGVSTPTPSPVSARVQYASFGGRLAAPRILAGFTAGYDIVTQRSALDGTHASLVVGDNAGAFVSRRDALTHGSVWSEQRHTFGDQFTVEVGLRLDTRGGPTGSALAQFAVSPDTRLSVGLGRAHQFTQGVALPLVGQGATLPTSWLTSDDSVPVMSVDNATVGLERWIGDGTLLTLNTYVRHTAGAITDDPTPGSLINRRLFVEASESANGVELGVRKLTGTLTGLLAYSYGKATTHASGLSFDAPSSRPQSLNAVIAAHLSEFNVGAAYALASGAPFTRMVVNGAGPAVREAPDAQHLPLFSSLDVFVDYTHVTGRVQWSAFAGAQNVLNRANATWYEISGVCRNAQSQLVTGAQCRGNDLFESPIGFAPTIGFRAVFPTRTRGN